MDTRKDAQVVKLYSEVPGTKPTARSAGCDSQRYCLTRMEKLEIRSNEPLRGPEVLLNLSQATSKEERMLLPLHGPFQFLKLFNGTGN